MRRRGRPQSQPQGGGRTARRGSTRRRPPHASCARPRPPSPSASAACGATRARRLTRLQPVRGALSRQPAAGAERAPRLSPSPSPGHTAGPGSAAPERAPAAACALEAPGWRAMPGPGAPQPGGGAAAPFPPPGCARGSGAGPGSARALNLGFGARSSSRLPCLVRSLCSRFRSSAHSNQSLSFSLASSPPSKTIGKTTWKDRNLIPYPQKPCWECQINSIS